MSTLTRVLKAIKFNQKKRDNLIQHVASCNKLIGLNQKHKTQLSLIFTLKNKYFNQLCKVQDVLKLEWKLYNQLMYKFKVIDQYTDFANNYGKISEFAKYYNYTMKQAKQALNHGFNLFHGDSIPLNTSDLKGI